MGVGDESWPGSVFCLEGCKGETSQIAGMGWEGLILLPSFLSDSIYYQLRGFSEPNMVDIFFVALMDFLQSFPFWASVSSLDPRDL